MKLFNLENAQKLNLTDLEIKFLEDLVENLYAEPHFSDVGIKEISENTGIKINSCKGVLSSLVKKGIVYVDDEFKDIVYLHDTHFNLHNTWINLV